ncbi:MAG: internalization-related competence protein ComEC/Rec2 [Gemmatimonadetes bacterium]|nr:internalization-related competence protein ComEC/Rec2 [Gemmatimonadota bacterium]
MPLVTALLLAWVGGLLLGFAALEGAFVALVLGGVLVTASWTLLERRRVIPALLVSGLAAWGVATATKREDDDCARQAARDVGWTARLDEFAEPGAMVHASLERCHARLILFVASGSAQAGARVRIIGSVRDRLGPRSDRLAIENAAVRQLDPPSLLMRWRTRATASVNRVFWRDAPLARALLVADMNGIDPDVRDAFARSGLAHALSISGLHVGILALALTLLGRMLGLTRAWADVVTVAVLATYVAMIGAPPPAVRSAAMLLALLVARWRGRPTSPWATLAVGAAFPLYDPRLVLDLGWQLSVIGVSALIASEALARRLAQSHARFHSPWLRGMLASVIASAASSPLVAWHFGRFSLIGPVANLVAGPVIGVAQPMLFMGLALSALKPVAQFVGDAVHPLLWLFTWIAERCAAIPYAALDVTPDALGALVAGIAVSAMLAACVMRHPGVALATSAAAITLLVWRPLIRAGAAQTELVMLDVGQGDALALHTRGNHWVLFDAGGASPGSDEGARTVVPYVSRAGGDVEALILSHPHTDHVGGAPSAIAALHPRRYLDAAFAGDASAYRASLVAARAAHAAWHRVMPGERMLVDEAMIEVLAPDSAWTAGLADPNNASVVVMVQVGRVRMLLTGDAETPEEEWMLSHGGQLQADILKVAHHGSATSSTPEFLDAVRPRLALVSVGAGNRYGHPSADVMSRLARAGAQVVRTDRLGTVVVRTDGNSIEVNAHGDRWTLAPRGAAARAPP